MTEHRSVNSMTPEEFLDELATYNTGRLDVLERAGRILPQIDALDGLAQSGRPGIEWRLPTSDELTQEFESECDISKIFSHLSDGATNSTRARERFFSAFSQGLFAVKEFESAEHGSWKTYRELLWTVSLYGGPKNVERFLDGLANGTPFPMPVFVRLADGTLIVGGGRTRTGFAALSGCPLQCLVIDERQMISEVVLPDAVANFKAYAAKHSKNEAQLERCYDQLAVALSGGDIEGVECPDGMQPFIFEEMLGIRAESIARLARKCA